MAGVENRRLDRILAAALDGTVVCRSSSPSKDAISMVVQSGAGSWNLEVVWAGEGWPDDVRRAAHGVSDPWPANFVLLARRLSPGAIEWLRERDANWADEFGQVRIGGLDGLLVVREPSLPPSQRGSRGFSWSPSALSIAEMILAHSDEQLRSEQLAGISGWSTPQVAAVLKAFDSKGWTAKRGPVRGVGAYRELIDADGMLAAWTARLAQEKRDVRLAHRATRDVMSLLRGELRSALERSVSWAVSGWGGLELVAPYVTTTPSLHIYVADKDFAGPLTAAIGDAGLREIDEGGRVVFWRVDSRVLALAQHHRRVPVVSSPRLYADLSSFDARGQDAADHVKRELIDPLHRSSSKDHAQAKSMKDQA